MAEAIGGIWVKSADLTRAWGIEPASGSVTGVVGAGDVAGVVTGAYYAFAIGGLVFHGVMSSVQVGAQRESGQEFLLEMVDNRVRLAWGMVFGQWNMPEEPDMIYSAPFPVPSGSAIDELSGGRVGFDMGVDFTGGLDGGEVGVSNGVDFGDGAFPDGAVVTTGLNTTSAVRGRLYSHIPPPQWGAQAKVFTRAPMSAAAILAEAFANAVGGFSFALNFHSTQRKPVFNVDANSGMSLAALVAQMCDAQGLQVTLDGSRTLRFSRRGGGVVLPPPPAHILRNGYAISSEPTRVRVVGDRCLVQINDIEMEPDWQPAWEKFISEPAWLAEVARVTPEVAAGPGGMAEIAARARELTVGQYLVLAGGAEVADEGSYADYGRWDKISRMDMPAWSYINSLVYRAYRIPDATLLYGIPMRSMEIHESLLCAVELTGSGVQSAIHYRQNPVEFYPSAAAYVIAKGQPLDLLDAAQRDLVSTLRLKNLREEWIEMSNFTLDAENHSLHFASPVFLDGLADEGKSILAYPNRGQAGYADLRETDLDADSDYLRLCVPNAAYEITHAAVRCSLVFKLGRFYKDYGRGARWTSSSASSIAEHLLDPSGGELSHDLVADYRGDIRMPTATAGAIKEILYDNGRTAEDEADDHAEGIIVRQGVEQAGSYCRYGFAGTSLTGAINRVNISLTRDDGLIESVEFAKPRATQGFVSSREIGNRIRSEELFSGQSDLQREIRNLRAISKLDRKSSTVVPRSGSHEVMADIFRRPIGAENPGVAVIPDPWAQWPVSRLNAAGAAIAGWRAGDLLWLDGEGLPSRVGKAFGGVVVADSVKKLVEGAEQVGEYVTIATSGMLPVACQPGIAAASALMAAPGDWKCTPGGTYPIGMLGHHEPVPGTGESTLALARMGGGGSESKIPPLTLVSSRPPYIEEPVTPVAEGERRHYITWGLVNGVILDNWGGTIDVPISAPTEGWLFIKAFVNTAKDETLRVLHCEWDIRPTQQAVPLTPIWPTDGTRPEFIIIPIGMIQVTDGVAHIHNVGGGSIEINEHIGRVNSGTSGSSVYLKQFSYRRLVY